MKSSVCDLYQFKTWAQRTWQKHAENPNSVQYKPQHGVGYPRLSDWYDGQFCMCSVDGGRSGTDCARSTPNPCSPAAGKQPGWHTSTVCAWAITHIHRQCITATALMSRCSSSSTT
eukprot:scpid86044/ scgid25896/ 